MRQIYLPACVEYVPPAMLVLPVLFPPSSLQRPIIHPSVLSHDGRQKKNWLSATRSKKFESGLTRCGVTVRSTA